MMLDAVREAAISLSARFPVDQGRLIDRDLSRRTAPTDGSANGHSRLLATCDGWLAVTLSRPDDLCAVAAWLEGDADADPWVQCERMLPTLAMASLLERADLLDLPVAALDEARGTAMLPVQYDRVAAPRNRMRVIDLSTLWAGPLCAGLLASVDAEVIRIDNRARPDPTPLSSPRLDCTINGGKRVVPLDLSTSTGRTALRDLVASADILVTSARRRGLASLGLEPTTLFADNPSLLWVAITAHGWESNRIGFGDDAAVAGGLVQRGSDRPEFLGDALADPLTGIIAAEAAMAMVDNAQAGLLDIAMARCAAQVAAML